MSAAPLVSVSMVTYNHEKYVGEAIRSVLGQSFGDLELVIVNDGSTDGTASQIAAFDDPRIVPLHQDNRGPSAATNRALAACRGKYVALFSGDDICHPDRIRRQVELYVRGSRGVLFAGCDFIDEDGHSVSGDHFAARIFDPTDRRRPEILARLFHNGNYFNGITAFTEREILLEAPYDPGLLQLQDFDVWSRLVKRYDLRTMADRLIGYRIRGGSGNLSSPTPERLLRLQNETYLILRRFLEGVSTELFREAFARELLNPDFADGPEYACEQAFLYCRSAAPLARLIGLERIQVLLNDPLTAEVLARRYAFTNQRFFQLVASVNTGGSYDGDYSSLFYDTGSGWNTNEQVGRRVLAVAGDVQLSFTLPPGVRAQALRWDPVELRTCRVRLDEIEVHDTGGAIRHVDFSTVEHNGVGRADGTVSFASADPAFWWPAVGNEAQVTIGGRWEFDDSMQTIVNQSQRIHELTGQIAVVREEMERVYASPSWRLTKPLRLAKSVARRLKAG